MLELLLFWETDEGWEWGVADQTSRLVGLNVYLAWGLSTWGGGGTLDILVWVTLSQLLCCLTLCLSFPHPLSISVADVKELMMHLMKTESMRLCHHWWQL